MTKYQRHKIRWQGCVACDLCETRTNVVLARGTICCDVLFVGEGPGASEDVLGKPFIGPAGKLLDEIIDMAWQGQPDLSWGFTNLVACIPIDEGGAKAGQPSAKSIKACAPRLNEFVSIATPGLIIAVGALADKQLPKILLPQLVPPIVTIEHPASILRQHITQRGLSVQRSVVTIADAISNLNGE